LVYYFAFFQPGQLHAQATATAQAIAASTASVHATATAYIEATATALNLTPEELYTSATSGTPMFDDPLNGPSDANWNTYTARDGSGCHFAGGALHLTASAPGDFPICHAPNSNYSDFAFQVQMTLLKGDANNADGFLFRSDASGSDAYYFLLAPVGLYILSSGRTTLASGTNAAIKTGFNQPNVFTVIARGSSFYLYANGQYLAMAKDNTYHAGEIALGVFAFTNAHMPVEAAFQNAKVWTL
jgi:hypothetical protein